jgi:hypothetical protein
MIEEQAQSFEQPQEMVRWYYQQPERLAEVEAVVLEDNVGSVGRQAGQSGRFSDIISRSDGKHKMNWQRGYDQQWNTEWSPQSLGLVPMVIEQSGRGEARLRHLFASAQRTGSIFGWAGE